MRSSRLPTVVTRSIQEFLRTKPSRCLHWMKSNRHFRRLRLSQRSSHPKLSQQRLKGRISTNRKQAYSSGSVAQGIARLTPSSPVLLSSPLFPEEVESCLIMQVSAHLFGRWLTPLWTRWPAEYPWPAPASLPPRQSFPRRTHTLDGSVRTTPLCLSSPTSSSASGFA